MNFQRFTAGIAASTLLVLGLVGWSASDTAMPVSRGSNPLPTSVSGPCFGGPGILAMTVYPRATDGTYQVDLTSNRMVDGSRWFVQVSGDGPSGSDTFKRTAVDGGWQATFTYGPVKGTRTPSAYASQRGIETIHRCQVRISADDPTYGISMCTANRDVYLVARRRDDGSHLVIFGTDRVRGGRIVWHVELTATGVEGRRSIAFDDRSKSGLLRSKWELHGIAQPWLRAVATREDGRRCRVRVDPGRAALEKVVAGQDLAADRQMFTGLRRG